MVDIYINIDINTKKMDLALFCETNKLESPSFYEIDSGYLDIAHLKHSIPWYILWWNIETERIHHVHLQFGG